MIDPSQLAEIKSSYSVEQAWADLGLIGRPGKRCRSPFPDEHANGDRNASFSIYRQGGISRWKNHATGANGDVIDFVMKAAWMTFPQAVEFIASRITCADFKPVRMEEEKKKPKKKPQLMRGTDKDIEHLAELRGIRPEALELARSRGILRFTSYSGYRAFAVTDGRRVVFETRRLDGQKWWGTKVLCFGTGKDWPIGIREAQPFNEIVLVEGGPDLLAAHDMFRTEIVSGQLAPVAMLGAGTHIATDSLKLFEGKQVFIWPHRDMAGAEAAERWKGQIVQVAEKVRGYVWGDLEEAAGKDINDLLVWSRGQ